MIDYTLSTMSLDVARVLLGDALLARWSGAASPLAAGGSGQTLVRWLDRVAPDHDWAELLAGLHVRRFDLNTATLAQLSRLPAITSEELEAIVRGRPHFSLAAFRAADPILAAVADRFERFLAGPVYAYVDRPTARTIALSVSDVGLLLQADDVGRAGEGTLRSLGLERLDVREGWCAGRWADATTEPTVLLRRLKAESWVGAVLPVFVSEQNSELLVVHPQDILVGLRPSGQPLTERVRELGYAVVQVHGGWLVRLRAPLVRHDPAAIFRHLDRLQSEPDVAFAEPVRWSVSIGEPR